MILSLSDQVLATIGEGNLLSPKLKNFYSRNLNLILKIQPEEYTIQKRQYRLELLLWFCCVIGRQALQK